MWIQHSTYQPRTWHHNLSTLWQRLWVTPKQILWGCETWLGRDFPMCELSSSLALHPQENPSRQVGSMRVSPGKPVHLFDFLEFLGACVECWAWDSLVKTHGPVSASQSGWKAEGHPLVRWWCSRILTTSPWVASWQAVSKSCGQWEYSPEPLLRLQHLLHHARSQIQTPEQAKHAELDCAAGIHKQNLQGNE